MGQRRSPLPLHGRTAQGRHLPELFRYGMFTGGLGFQYGAERLGMLTVPAAAGNTKRQIKFITDFGTTACMPFRAMPDACMK